jgi:hypothetical protein
MSGGGYRDAVEREIPVHDVFPDAISGEEVDRRIASSESRIKFWVVACVATNLVLALPTIFYMGRMAQSVEEMSSSVKELQANRQKGDSDSMDQRIWNARVEAALRAKGIIVP